MGKMHTFDVVKRKGDYYVVGLKDFDEPDTYLICRYDEGDCDRPYKKELMHRALYDLFQCHDGLQFPDGDEVMFFTPFGEFVSAGGIHIVPVKEV